MPFKLQPPYFVDNTPIYRVNDDERVNGRANKNGSITINPENMDSPAQEENTISHEMTHVNQFKDFAKSEGKEGLDYSDNHITWQGKRHPRRDGKILYQGKWRPEGWPKFPWEKEAYDKETPIT